jgi:N-acetylglutamate synthase-like GNAT family acetyltransferase
MHIELREPQTVEEFSLYYDLRWRILREPWRRGRESARDGLEEGAFHLMALRDGIVAGVGRLHFNSTDEAQVRYMAVEAGQQGHGVGSRILERLEQHASERGARRVVLNAREGAIPFYRRHGYELEDVIETAFECVPHWRMTKVFGE